MFILKKYLTKVRKKWAIDDKVSSEGGWIKLIYTSIINIYKFYYSKG